MKLCLGPLANDRMVQTLLLIILFTRTQLQFGLGWAGPIVTARKWLPVVINVKFLNIPPWKVLLPKTVRLEGAPTTYVLGPSTET